MEPNQSTRMLFRFEGDKLIFKNISKEHILKAIKYVDDLGVPKEMESTKYELVYSDNLYPPKHVISIANKFANGRELSSSEFSGSDETNNILINLGFIIRNKILFQISQ